MSFIHCCAFVAVSSKRGGNDSYLSDQEMTTRQRPMICTMALSCSGIFDIGAGNLAGVDDFEEYELILSYDPMTKEISKQITQAIQALDICNAILTTGKVGNLDLPTGSFLVDLARTG